MAETRFQGRAGDDADGSLRDGDPDRRGERDEDRDDPVLVHSRREALAVTIAWCAAAAYTIAVSFWLGADDGEEPVQTMLGVPSWVVWGVIAPWLACLGFAWWFSFRWIRDDDLGEDPESAGSAGPRSDVARGGDGDASQGDASAYRAGGSDG